MAGKLSPERERAWMIAAARAVARLLKELGLDSYKSAAKLLRVNERTMLKLNPAHPGTGLKPETLDVILYRIEATLRSEEPHRVEEIVYMMSQARWEISLAFYGEFQPRY